MAEDTQAQNPTEQPSSDETLKTEKTVPYDRFSQVLSDKKALEKRLADIEATQKAQETQSLAEQNRWKELYEKLLAEHEPLKHSHEEAKRYRERLEADNQSRIERIPEDKRSLIPEYDDPVKMGAWLTTNEAVILAATKPNPPNMNGGAGGGGSARESATTLSADAQGILDVARGLGYNVNPERAAQFARNPIKPSKTGE